MNAPVVNRQIRLEPRHRPTGKTRHYRGRADWHREEFSSPAAFQFARRPEDLDFHLFLEAGGDGVTDTHHGSLEDAMSQAEREFGVGVDEWTVLPVEGTR